MSDTALQDPQSTEVGPGGGISFRQPKPAPASGTDQEPILSPALQSIFSSLTPAIGTLSAIVAQGADAGKFDSTQSLTKYMAALEEAAKKAPSVYELQAKNTLQESKAAGAMAEFEKANPLQSPQMLTAPQYAPLQLPGVPNDVQPRPNRIASLGAGIAGLFAPRAAGRFASEALSGAIAATDRENAARKQKYQLDLQQSLLKHTEAVRQSDAQAEIDAQNNKLTNAFSAEQHGEKLKSAFDTFNAAKLKGEAGNLELFAKGDVEAKALKLKADQLGLQLEAAEKDAKDKRDAAIRAAGSLGQVAEHFATLQQHYEALDETKKKDAAAAADKAEQTKIRQANEARQERHDQEAEAIQRSRMSIEEKNSALRALEINNAHQDRLRGQDLKGQSDRSSNMHHKGPLELSADEDMRVTGAIYEAARKAYVNNPEGTGLKEASQDAERRYNRARENATKVGDAAIAAEKTDRKKGRVGLPGMPSGGAVLSGPGFSLTPR